MSSRFLVWPLLGMLCGAASAEERILVWLPVLEYGRSVCSVTLRDLDGTHEEYRTERPGDDVERWVNRFTHRLAKLRVCAKVGSEFRIMGTVKLTATTDRLGNVQPVPPRTVTVAGSGRLCFRKTKKGWAYLCGSGTIADEGGKIQRLGFERTVESCLAALDSPDEIVREGCARDLGRLSGEADRAQVLERLRRLLADPVPEVRRGAAEAMGLLAAPESVAVLKATRETEKDRLTQEYIGEALALLGAAALFRDNAGAGLPIEEAARLYSAGRDAWADDALAARFRAAEPALVVLRSRLGAGSSDERVAGVRLVKALNPAWAQEALAVIAEKDSDNAVKLVARQALESLRTAR